MAIALAFQANAQEPQVKSRIDSVSYLAGQNIAQSVLKDFPEANVTLLLQGLSDAMMQRPSIIQDPTNQCVMSYFQEKMQAVQQAEEAVNQEALAAEKEAGRVNREKGGAVSYRKRQEKRNSSNCKRLAIRSAQKGQRQQTDSKFHC